MAMEGRISSLILEEEMRTSYLNYAMSVIVGRALPDVRDGLKPVQRRILYAMRDLGLAHNRPHKKSARVTGEVLGKYHPHGDMAVYEAMVRMAQDFSLRYPLVDGQGNFGSVDGDPAAAQRYTEVRLSAIAEEMLEDLDKETVDFVPNFDNSLKEPSVLPAKIPNLLLNGSSGIAVGMATNIPPHNLSELVDGLVKVIENPQISLEELLKIIKGPDFPTGGIILRRDGIEKAYEKGKGKIILRGKVDIENADGGENIIITELPYQVNKAKLVEEIAELAQNDKIKGIRNVRDESDKGGIRVVIELSRGASAEVILNQLYKYTSLQITFGIIMLALVDGKPELLSLPQAMKLYLRHRKEVVTRRTKFELAKEEKRARILEGFRKALSDLDRVIKLIRSSSSPQEARKSLIELLEISEEQARAILEMRLERLTRLERDKIERDYESSLKVIDRLRSLLSSEEKIWQTIKEELLELKKKYGDRRRTVIQEREEKLVFRPEDLIKKEDILITLTSQGYIKYTPLRAYNRQNRGGKGMSGILLERGDFVKDLILASTHSILLFFTNSGRVHWAMAYDIPQKKRSAKGRAIVNFLSLKNEESISTVIPVDDFGVDKFLFMVTKKGMVKKTSLSAYSRPKKGGIIAITLKNEDELIKVMLTSGKQDILLSTKRGRAIVFSEKDVRPTGRSSAGVKGIELEEGDEVRGAVIVEDDEALFTVTTKGFGKRTLLSRYRKTKRGGKGIIDIRLVSHKGEVVGVKKVGEKDEVVVITRKGKSIRLAAKNIPLIGRNTTGSRIIKIEDDDEVVALA
ncbi:DNA gyrase subunit A [Candidatus Aerophobetes bacterium]|nr:DNA gyrase subunit A [Candidatus Aerophobetes bacterium]